MKSHRYRVVIIGNQSAELISEVTNQLSLCNFETESISSLRLGHSLILLLLIESTAKSSVIESCLKSIIQNYGAKLVIDECTRKKFKFIKSNVFMRVKGNHIKGVKPYIISEFTNAGLDIHALDSESQLLNKKIVFVINIKGQIKSGIEALRPLADRLEKNGLNVTIAKAWELLI